MRKSLALLGAALVALVLASVARAALRVAYDAGSANPRVWLADSRGKHPARLGPGSGPLLSPNGALVAASLFATKGAALSIYSPGSATHSYFNVQKVSATPLAWSPDSRYVAIQLSGVGVMGRGSGLVIIDTRSGTVHKLARGSVCGASFAPSAADRLVYGRAPGAFSCFNGDVNLYTSRPGGTGRHKLTRDGESGNPVWGADGIAFDRSTQRKNLAPSLQVWVMRSNGSHQRQITKTSVPPLLQGLVPVAFSASGKRLLADYEGEDTTQTWTIQLPSGRVHHLRVKGRDVVPYGISSNGKLVLIGYGGFESPPSAGVIETIPFGGGHASVLIRHGANATWNR